jgi:hypothetical protein
LAARGAPDRASTQPTGVAARPARQSQQDLSSLLDLRRFQRELNAGRLRRKCLVIVISNLPEELDRGFSGRSHRNKVKASMRHLPSRLSRRVIVRAKAAGELSQRSALRRQRKTGFHEHVRLKRSRDEVCPLFANLGGGFEAERFNHAEAAKPPTVRGCDRDLSRPASDDVSTFTWLSLALVSVT